MGREQLIAAIKAALGPARDIAERAEKEGRQLTDAERTVITDAVAKAEPLKDQLNRLDADSKARRQLSAIDDGIGIDPDGAKSHIDTDNQDGSGLLVPTRQKSAGQLFVTSEQYKRLTGQARGGHFAKDQRIQGESVQFKTLITGGSDTSAGALVVNDNIGLNLGLNAFQRELVLRDVITVGQTSSDTVEYVQLTSTTNNAAPVAEATTDALPTQNGSTGPLINNAGGGYKPQSAMALVKKTAVVKTIAHWIPATKRALADASQIRTLIDAFLMYGLDEELEDQIMTGDASGENFDGIEHISGTQAQAFSSDLFTTTRKARTKLRKTHGVQANAWLMAPEDAETFDLLTDSNDRFYFGGPYGLGPNTPLWGLPIIQSEAVTPGTAWLGDWRQAVLWDRQQSAITATDSHADFFIRNLVAILAEMRAAFGVVRPDAFVEVALS
jgi:HK97 family phage major capsid protein